MHIPTYWFALALFLVSMASLGMALRVWHLPPFPGRAGFTLTMLATMWWAGAVALEHAVDQPGVKVILAEVAWFGIAATPAFWALFVWSYILRPNRPLPRGLYLVVLLIAACAGGIAITNGIHHQFYTATLPTGTPPYLTMRYVHGPLFYLLVASSYVVLVGSDAAIVFAIVSAQPVYRTHYIGFAVASLLPWTLNAIYVTRAFKALTIDPTPFGFFAMNIIMFWLISRQRLFDLLPVAHGVLFDALPDPVLVLDPARRIADSNAAARALAGGRPLVGQAIDALAQLRQGLGSLVGSVAEQYDAMIGDPPRYFDVRQVPLTYTGHAVGQLVLLRDISHRKEAERRLETALADLEVQLRNNVVLQQQLREAAIRDVLTGLHNRRFLAEWGPVLLAEAKRSGSPLAAVMIDIDHFKRLNDTYGHQAGDAVLQASGRFLRENARESDAVFRMGGEEFLVLLPHTQEEQALARAEAWRGGFMAQTITHDGIGLNATVSAGLAMYAADAVSLEDLLHRADTALYRAKAAGRNRVMRWQPDGA